MGIFTIGADTPSYGSLVAVLERDVEIRVLANVQILKWSQVACDKNQIASSLLPLSPQRQRGPAARPQRPSWGLITIFLSLL